MCSLDQNASFLFEQTSVAGRELLTLSTVALSRRTIRRTHLHPNHYRSRLPP